MTNTTNDWFRRPLAAFLWWGIPLGLGVATNSIAMSPRAAALVWTISFVWMGIGCAFNAYRCHRLHCYISGPVLLLGAIATGLFAANFLHGHLSNVVNLVLALALLSFVPEIVSAQYKRARR